MAVQSALSRGGLLLQPAVSTSRPMLETTYKLVSVTSGPARGETLTPWRSLTLRTLATVDCSMKAVRL